MEEDLDRIDFPRLPNDLLVKGIDYFLDKDNRGEKSPVNMIKKALPI